MSDLVEERNRRLEKELFDSMEETVGVTEEECIANYWALIDSVRKSLMNLLGDLLQAKLLLKGCRQDYEIAERPDEKGEWMVCCPTGKQTLTIECVDLEAQEKYQEWVAESEHVPTIVKSDDSTAC